MKGKRVKNQTPFSTYLTADNDACNTYHTKTV